MKIILDAFGGDNAPLEVIRGGALAAKDGYEIALVGDEETIRRVAKENGVSLAGMSVISAPDVMPMEAEPRAILKAYKESSMAVGLLSLAAGDGDVFVSAGSTGALLMGATFFVKRLKGVPRAAIGALIPTATGTPSLLLDAGANADCRPEMLCQFAQMGSVYMSEVIGKDATVGLVNIGTEDCKGGELQQAAFSLIRESGVNFIGNVEARQVPYGAADVLVADGFTGNVLLKAMEGTAAMLMSEVKGLFMTNFATKIGGLLVKPYIGTLKKRMDVREYGGAPVLGVSRPVFKAHGNSDAVAIANACRAAAKFAETGVVATLAQKFAEGVSHEEQ